MGIPQLKEVKEVRENADAVQGSKEKGVAGLFETLLRRFKAVAHVATLIPLYTLAASCMGMAIVPGAVCFQMAHEFFRASHFWRAHPYFQLPLYGIVFSVSYFLYGFTLIFLIPTVNFLLRAKLKPSRGTYYSVKTLNWYVHNGLTYIVRFTFLEFLTPTPFNILFYRLMGMKIGRNVQINSTHISDPSLIELGDRVTIGGTAAIMGHYGAGGFLILAPVKIGEGTTIGLRASVMGGVTIGKNVKILPHSVVLPKTVIPDGEMWGGVPARKIEKLD